MVILLLGTVVPAQNLIPNGDFEQYYSCPDHVAQIDSAVHWFDPTGAAEGSPDYFNGGSSFAMIGVPQNFAGYQQARSGMGYVGLTAYATPWIFEFREYVEVGMSTELVKDSCYLFSMHVSLARKGTFATKDIGAYFSDTAITGVLDDDALPFVPQVVNSTGFILDTLGWTEISDVYVAHGGERYVTIGNFLGDDSISLMLVDSALNYHAIYFYIDDVSMVQVGCSVGIGDWPSQANVRAFPNPTAGDFNVEVDEEGSSNIRILDASGRLIMVDRFAGKITLDLHHLTSGLYVYEIVLQTGTVSRGRFLKM